LTVETVFLKTLYVLVFMHIHTRRVLGIAVSANPNGTWVTQRARNLMMDLDEDPELLVRFLLRDRDAKYGRSFDNVFGTESIEVALTLWGKETRSWRRDGPMALPLSSVPGECLF
jgi:putative transposase